MKRVLMLLANGVEPLEMAAFTDVIGWADLLGDDSVELIHAGLRRRIVTTFGLTISPSFLLQDLDISNFDALAIPGGFEPAGFYEDALSESFLATIRDFDAAGKIIASVCVASVCLGAAGVLRGKNATTYHQEGGRRKKQLLETGAIFVDRPVIVDGSIITSSGPGTATEVAFELLARLTSVENATFIRHKMRFAVPGQDWYEAPQVP